MTGLFFILKIKMLVPNKPDNNGSNGCLTSRFRMINPKLPDNKKMIKAGIFLLSGSLGLIILNLDVKQPLLPLLSGLFGTSILILSIKNKPVIPQQIIEFPKIEKKEFIKAIFLGFLSSITLGFLPSVSSSQSSAISSSFQRLKRNTFLILTGFTSASFAMLSLIALFSIEKTRSGFLVVISRLLPEIKIKEITIFILTALIAASTASIITIKLARYFSRIITKINYQLICILALLVIIILVTIISEPLGLLVLITSTALGTIPQLKRISKVTLIGCLILPTILFLLY